MEASFELSRSELLGSANEEHGVSDSALGTDEEELSSASPEASLLEKLADELTARFLYMLTFVEPMDLVNVSLCCKQFYRTLERDESVWGAALQRSPTLVTYLGLPRCFSNRQKVLYALKTLRGLEKEAATLRASLEKERVAPSVEDTWSSLKKFVLSTREPLLNSSTNTLLAKTKRKIGLGKSKDTSKEDEAVSAAIDKRLAKDKPSESNKVTQVLLIGLDPVLTFQFWLQAAQLAAKSEGAALEAAETMATRDAIWSLILTESQALVRSALARLGGRKLADATRILTAPRTPEGFLSVAQDLPAFWTDYGNGFLSQLSFDLKRRHGRILSVLAAQYLVQSARWADVKKPTYRPNLVDAHVAGGSPYGARIFSIVSRNLRVRITDVTVNLLNCKRSRVLQNLLDEKGKLNFEMAVGTLDVVSQAPSQVIKCPTWGLFEQMKLLEQLLNSAFLRGINATVIANIDGVEAFLNDGDPKQELLFLRERLRVLSRMPNTLLLPNIVLTRSNETRLCEQVIAALYDLFLARNIQRGF